MYIFSAFYCSKLATTLLIVFVLSAVSADRLTAQDDRLPPLARLWENTAVVNSNDLGFEIIPTSDGNFVLCGQTDVNAAGQTGAFLLKIDINGNQIWTNPAVFSEFLGNPITGYAVAEDHDNGLVVVGNVGTAATGDRSIVLFKTDVNGNFVWSTGVGFISNEELEGFRVEARGNGCYLITGRCYPSFGGSFMVALEVCVSGTWPSISVSIPWQETLASTAPAYPAVFPDYIAVQGIYVQNGANTEIVYCGGGRPDASSGDEDAIVRAVDPSGGGTNWFRSYGLAGHSEQATDIKQTSDGGYIVTGRTIRQNDMDVLLLRLDAVGNLLWSTSIDSPGGTAFSDEIGYSVIEVGAETGNPDGFVICGNSNGFGFESMEAFIMGVNALGEFQWARVIRKAYDTPIPPNHTPEGQGTKVIQACGGRYLVSGWIRSNVDNMPASSWGTLFANVSPNDISADCFPEIELQNTDYEALEPNVTAHTFGMLQPTIRIVAGEEGTFEGNVCGACDQETYHYPTFQAHYGIAHADIGESGSAIHTTGDIFLGYIQVGRSARAVYAVRTDRTGDTVWTMRYEPTSTPLTDAAAGANSVFHNGELEYYVAGWIDPERSCADNNIYAFGRNILLMQMNDVGGIDWSFQYGICQDQSGEHTEEAAHVEAFTFGPDNFIGVAGYAHDEASSRDDVFFMMTDDTGALILRNRYGEPAIHERGTCFMRTAQDNFILSGYAGEPGVDSRGLLLLIENTGMPHWAVHYGDQNSVGPIEFNFVRQTDDDADGLADDGYIAVGFAQAFGWTNSANIIVLKTDVDGNTQWAKLYGGDIHDVSPFDNRNDAAFAIRQTADGGYIVTGDTENSTSNTIDAFLMKLDGCGEIQWTHAYGQHAEDHGRDVGIAGQNLLPASPLFIEEYVMFGSTCWPEHPDQLGKGDFYLVATNCAGNVNRIGGSRNCFVPEWTPNVLDISNAIDETRYWVVPMDQHGERFAVELEPFEGDAFNIHCSRLPVQKRGNEQAAPIADEAKQVFPNPVDAGATIEFVFLAESAESGKVQLFDITGQSRYTKHITVVEGANTLSLSTHGLQAGLYVLKLVTTSGQERQFEFVVQ